MKQKLRMIRVFMFLPLGLALAYLVVSPSVEGIESYLMYPCASYSYLALLLLLPVVFLIFGSFNRQHIHAFKRLAVLSPCFLAPMAIFNAWTLAPGLLLGIGWGGYGYFLEWLTKYPSLGPFNLDILLGILCVSVSSCVPAVFAGCAITRRLGRRTTLAFLTIVLPCLIAVIIHLDLALMLVGLWDKAPTLFMGPLLRLSGAISMCAIAITFLKNPGEGVRNDM